MSLIGQRAWPLWSKVVREAGSSCAASFRRLNEVDWSQLHAKAACAVWAIVLFTMTPDVLAGSLGTVLVWIMTGAALVGSVVSSIGLVIAARDPEHEPALLRVSLRRSLRGLGVEMVGLILVLVGIGLYWLTQAVLSLGPGGSQRSALALFAYFAGAMTIGRLVAVVHRRRKEMRVASTIGGTT